MQKIFSVVFLLFGLTFFGSCQNTSSNAQTNPVTKTVTVEQFEKKLSSTPNAQLIDVRTAGEYADRHLKNAINMDVRADNCKEQFATLDKSKPVFVYCLSGGRSANAANILQGMGFHEIYNMDGGIIQWENSGRPVEHGNASPRAESMSLSDFSKQLMQKKYVLVDYNAPWCEQCKKMLPYLEALAKQKNEKLSLLKINADDNKALLKEKSVTGIPHLELYEDGQLVWKHDGFIEEKQLLQETKL